MSETIRIRTSIEGDTVDVRLLIKHPMEVGSRTEDDRPQVAPHYITELSVRHRDEFVMRAHWGPGIARNPFLSFRVRDARPGESLRIDWVDNKGRTDELEVTL